MAWSSSVRRKDDDGATTQAYRGTDPGDTAIGREWCDGRGTLSLRGHQPQAFYVWKRRCAGTGLSELRQLREENIKLKRLVSDLSLDQHMLHEIVRKDL
jgi:hypothetical protein